MTYIYRSRIVGVDIGWNGVEITVRSSVVRRVVDGRRLATQVAKFIGTYHDHVVIIRRRMEPIGRGCRVVTCLVQVSSVTAFRPQGKHETLRSTAEKRCVIRFRLCALIFQINNWTVKPAVIYTNNSILWLLYLESLNVHTIEHFGIVVTANVNDQMATIASFERVHRMKKEESVRHVFNSRLFFASIAVNQPESCLKSIGLLERKKIRDSMAILLPSSDAILMNERSVFLSTLKRRPFSTWRTTIVQWEQNSWPSLRNCACNSVRWVNGTEDAKWFYHLERMMTSPGSERWRNSAPKVPMFDRYCKNLLLSNCVGGMIDLLCRSCHEDFPKWIRTVVRNTSSTTGKSRRSCQTFQTTKTF